MSEIELTVMSEEEYDKMFPEMPLDEEISGLPTNAEIRHSSRLMLTTCIPGNPDERDLRLNQVLFAINVRRRCGIPIPSDWMNEYTAADNNRKH